MPVGVRLIQVKAYMQAAFSNLRTLKSGIQLREENQMAQFFTKTTARNIYIGGTMFFILLFLALTFDTSRALTCP